MYRAGGVARKTDVVAFRIPAEKLERLRKEAKLRKVSVNVMANHIFDGFFDFQLAANNAGFISLPRKSVRNLINALRDEEIAILAKGPLKSDFEDLVYMMKGRITLQSFLDAFFAWARDANFPYRDEFEDGNTSITIHHNMGKKWSLLLKECLAQALENLARKVTFEIREDVLIMNVEE
jgi:hypothetical protein